MGLFNSVPAHAERSAPAPTTVILGCTTTAGAATATSGQRQNWAAYVYPGVRALCSLCSMGLIRPVSRPACAEAPAPAPAVANSRTNATNTNITGAVPCALPNRTIEATVVSYRTIAATNVPHRVSAATSQSNNHISHYAGAQDCSQDHRSSATTRATRPKWPEV